MIPERQQTEIIAFVSEEARRLQYGKIIVEITVHDSKCTNITAETRRSKNLSADKRSVI